MSKKEYISVGNKKLVYKKKSDRPSREDRAQAEPREKRSRIKLNKSEEFEMVASCMQNIEEELVQEITEIGGTHIQRHKRAVSFRGDLSVLYKANIWLRTALKVLRPIHTFKATNEEQLYKRAKQFAWNELFSSDKTFYIDFAVNSIHFSHSQFAALKLKDAIVDKFREAGVDRPSVSKEDADVKIHLHIRNEFVNISLDSSGEPLFKRGYRREHTAAPLNETLAAALILKSQWKGDKDFFDPMCGSGTIAIEAALIAANIPPNYNRTHFAFESWADYDQELFSRVLGEAKAMYRTPKCKIYAQDISQYAVRAARINIDAVNLKNYIQIKQANFFEEEPPTTEGIIIMNPPYGERLNVSGDLASFYAKIGDRLKHSYAGWTAWVFTMDKEAVKNIGLKAKKRVPLMNGKLPCNFIGFELFKGKRIDMLKGR